MLLNKLMVIFRKFPSFILSYHINETCCLLILDTLLLLLKGFDPSLISESPQINSHKFSLLKVVHSFPNMVINSSCTACQHVKVLKALGVGCFGNVSHLSYPPWSLYAGLSRWMPNADQNYWPQCRSILLSLCQINASWPGIIKIERHWALIKGVLYTVSWTIVLHVTWNQLNHYLIRSTTIIIITCNFYFHGVRDSE